MFIVIIRGVIKYANKSSLNLWSIFDSPHSHSSAGVSLHVLGWLDLVSQCTWWRLQVSWWSRTPRTSGWSRGGRWAGPAAGRPAAWQPWSCYTRRLAGSYPTSWCRPGRRAPATRRTVTGQRRMVERLSWQRTAWQTSDTAASKTLVLAQQNYCCY